MSTIALTGSGGFLGWHTRAALRENNARVSPFAVGSDFDLDVATAAVSGADRAIHVAGVNRGTDDDVREGNLTFAEQFVEAILGAPEPPRTVVFANSTQSATGGIYGDAKAAAAKLIAQAADRVGATFVDVVLPNLFGEHGRPFYNSVTATFCHLLADGGHPEVQDDKELTLLHVQDAADQLLGMSDGRDETQVILVSELLDRLSLIAQTYRAGEIPDVADAFSRNLFNTYRSFVFPSQAPIELTRHADARGSFFEVVRSHGGDSQSSFSTTVPGVTRGDHFHRRKVERFTVLSGEATIALRKVFSTDVVSFHVTGENPVAVDMPTMWAHSITNTGTEPLYTSFWTNDIFDPERPDTIPEAVK